MWDAPRVMRDGKMGPNREDPGRQKGSFSLASCGSAAAVCVQPGRVAPTALGAPGSAQGACRALPDLDLWKSLIEMQVIKSNVSCSIHFHCTTTFTSPILSGISAAPLSLFSLVRAVPVLPPLRELGGGDNSKSAGDY